LSTLVSANGQPWNITDGPVGTQYVNAGGASGYVPNNLFSFDGTLNGQPYAIQANTALPESVRSTQFTVNGQFQPTLSAPKGQTEIWSIVNNSDLAYARLRLTNTADGSHPQIIVLGQDGIAKGFCGNARAIRNEKNSAVGHGDMNQKVERSSLDGDPLK
jgi:hypothetical protein